MNKANISDVAKLANENTFLAKQTIENGNLGVDSPALMIRARTDQNTYSRPAIRFDCYGTVEASLFLDIDGKLKLKVGATTYTINMT